MKRFITLFLAIAFLSTASASTGATQGLSLALKELNYTLNVEWDQKDPAFHKAAMEKFRVQLQTLKAQGLSNQAMIEGALAEVKNEALKKELSEAYTLINAQKLDAEAAQNVILEAAERARSQGASWVGGLPLIQWVGIAIAVALIISAFSGSSSSGEACTTNCPTQNYSCGYQYVCGWGYDYWNNYSYNCDYQYVCGWYYWP